MDQSEPNVNVSIVDLSSLTPDPRNANRGTERGRYMVARSHEKFGAARSGVIDRNGVIIAGNKSAEAQAELGMDRVIVVETDGSMPVYVRRSDLDIDDPKARELAYADNRTSEVDLQWDAEQIARDQLDGIDVSDFFRQDEIDAIFDKSQSEEREDQREFVEVGEHLPGGVAAFALIAFPVDRLGDLADALGGLVDDPEFEIRTSTGNASR